MSIVNYDVAGEQDAILDHVNEAAGRCVPSNVDQPDSFVSLVQGHPVGEGDTGQNDFQILKLGRHFELVVFNKPIDETLPEGITVAFHLLPGQLVGNDRCGEILIAQDMTTVMVGIYQIDNLLIGYFSDLLPPPAGLRGDHRAINEHNAFAGHHETDISSPHVRFCINILSELLHLLICLPQSL